MNQPKVRSTTRRDGGLRRTYVKLFCARSRLLGWAGPQRVHALAWEMERGLQPSHWLPGRSRQPWRTSFLPG
jgi:hypothetical protein